MYTRKEDEVMLENVNHLQFQQNYTMKQCLANPSTYMYSKNKTGNVCIT